MRVASCISGGATTTTTARTRHWTTAHQQSSPLPVLSPRCVFRSWTGGFAETVAQVSASSKDVERYGPNRTTQAEIAILRWLRNAGRVNQPETNSRLGTEILVRSAEKFLRYTSSSNGTKDRALQMDLAKPHDGLGQAKSNTRMSHSAQAIRVSQRCCLHMLFAR